MQIREQLKTATNAGCIRVSKLIKRAAATLKGKQQTYLNAQKRSKSCVYLNSWCHISLLSHQILSTSLHWKFVRLLFLAPRDGIAFSRFELFTRINFCPRTRTLSPIVVPSSKHSQSQKPLNCKKKFEFLVCVQCTHITQPPRLLNAFPFHHIHSAMTSAMILHLPIKMHLLSASRY